ncbi:hypothetical protein DXG01_009565 [Tephrocybe rancida]|nr:hypothetical protein DXG01_009565 [Tephrocybe rancida]
MDPSYPSIPPEIISLIIRNVSYSRDTPSERRALSGCCLASSWCRKHCQEIMFRSISLNTATHLRSQSRNHRFRDIIVTNSSIKLYVRNLALTITGDDPISAELKIFTRIRVIDIFARVPLTPKMQDSVLGVLKLRSLQKVVIVDPTHFPFNLLTYCLSLEGISILSYTYDHPDGKSEVARATRENPMKLKYLRVDHPRMVRYILKALDYPLAAISLSYLITLEIPALTEDTIKEAQHLLDLSASSISELMIQISGK